MEGYEDAYFVNLTAMRRARQSPEEPRHLLHSVTRLVDTLDRHQRPDNNGQAHRFSYSRKTLRSATDVHVKYTQYFTVSILHFDPQPSTTTKHSYSGTNSRICPWWSPIRIFEYSSVSVLSYKLRARGGP
jgi:hypothetical protein